MAVITSGSWSELITVGLDVVWNQADLTYNSKDSIYKKFMFVEPSKKSSVTSMDMAAFGLIPEKSKGSNVDYYTANQGYKKTVSNLTYKAGFTVEKELVEDELYDQIMQLPEAMKFSALQTRETLCANIINNSKSSSYTGADGVELASLLHPLVDGGYLANEPSTEFDLSMAGLEQAYIDVAAFTTHSGLKLNTTIKKIMVHPNQYTTAKQLNGSEKDPESSANAINPWNGQFEIIVNPFMTDTDMSVFLTDLPGKFGLIYQERLADEFSRDNDFDSDSAKFKLRFRGVATWRDPRCCYITSGA